MGAPRPRSSERCPRSIGTPVRHHRNPHDNTLLWDVVRVVSRLVGQLAAVLERRRFKGFCDRTRAARRRMLEIQRMTVRQRQEQQTDTYRELIGIAGEVVAAARGVLQQTAKTRCTDLIADLPLAYEVLPGNTADNTTLRGFLDHIERRYGKARRIWLMDRGIPTEEVLAEMRAADPPVQYVGLSRLEQALLAKPWQEVRPGVVVKLLPQDGELYVLAQSRDRVAKERAMRRRQLKWLWKRLGQLAAMKLTREELLMKLGAARSRAPTAWRLVRLVVAKTGATFSYHLDRDKLRQARRREGRYLLRTNLTGNDPASLWSYYLQLVAVEEAFKNLKGDLAIRPIFHHDQARVEAHIFIAFLAYCLHVTLGRRLHALAPGLTPRSVLAKFGAVQMIDVHVPTTDGRELVLTRHTEPEPELRLLLDKLRLELPAQPPPKIIAQVSGPHPSL
jgi:hypothetical protein